MTTTVYVYRPGMGTPSEVVMTRPLTLKQAQVLVGGAVEQLPMWFQFRGMPCVALADEEGSLKGLQPNMAATAMWMEDIRRQHPGVNAYIPPLFGPVAVITGDLGGWV